jgi:hypothetical protein
MVEAVGFLTFLGLVAIPKPSLLGAIPLGSDKGSVSVYA